MTLAVTNQINPMHFWDSGPSLFLRLLETPLTSHFEFLNFPKSPEIPNFVVHYLGPTHVSPQILITIMNIHLWFSCSYTLCGPACQLCSRVDIHCCFPSIKVDHRCPTDCHSLISSLVLPGWLLGSKGIEWGGIFWGQCVTTWIFLRHTADVQSDSGCPTPCNGCSILYYRTNSCPTRLSVPMFFPFCYDSNISLIYCGRPVGLRMSDSVQWSRHFCIIGQLTPNLAKCSDVFPFITFHLSFFQIYFIVTLLI